MQALPIVEARSDADGDRRSNPSNEPARPVVDRDVGDDDLRDLLVEFYATIASDRLLAPYFAVVDMSQHMPRIVAFWSTLLFHTGRYNGNAFRPHAEMPGLTPDHFAHWVATLERVIDARFAGPKAEQMKALGHRIAYSMQLRLGLEPFAAFAGLLDR